MFTKVLEFFSLKRKLASTEEAETTIAESSNRPTKRVRIEEPSSTIEEYTQPTTPVQHVCITEDEEEEVEVLDQIIPRGTKGKEIERLEELEEEVKETRAIAAQLREETRSYVESIDGTVNCVVCLDFIRNPQVLTECRHTVCYPCLRTWFTGDAEGDDDDAPMVSTDAESDGEDTPEAGPSNATPPPPRHRHRFRSAINRRKVCPECSFLITRRPVPSFPLRHLVDRASGSESPLPSSIESRHGRTAHKVSKRKDLWRGIFPGESCDKKSALRHDFQNAKPTLEDRNLEWMRWRLSTQEAGRRRLMRQLWEDEELVDEQRRRRPIHVSGEHPEQAEPMERRIRGLPVRSDRAPVSPLLPAPAAPLPPLIQLPAPMPPVWTTFLRSRPASPRQDDEFWSGLDVHPPPHAYTTVVVPPPPPLTPSAAGPSTATPSPTPFSNGSLRGPSPPILESLQQLRRRYIQSSPQLTRDVDDEWDGTDDDEDLPLFTAMMQRRPNASPHSDSQREYPVYVEDLHLEEDPLLGGEH